MRIFYAKTAQIAPILTVLAAGCANHPTVQDVTRLTTYDIVHKVRCEARGPLELHASSKGFSVDRFEGVNKLAKKIQELEEDRSFVQLRTLVERTNAQVVLNYNAIQDLRVQIAALESLTETHQRFFNNTVEQLRTVERYFEQRRFSDLTKGIEELRRRAAKITGERASLKEKIAMLRERLARREAANASLLKRQELHHPFLAKYKSYTKELRRRQLSAGAEIQFMTTNIAMQFRFDITETNNATVDGSYKMPFSSGTLNIGFAAGTNHTRRGERAVGISSSFHKLLKLDCTTAMPSDRTRADFYPIRGNVGMREVVGQYLKLQESAEFGPSAATVGTTKQYSDRLVFTTKVAAGATPKLELNPTNVHKVTLNGGFGAGRDDIHEVIVDIAAPGTAPKSISKISVERIPDVLLRFPPPDIGEDLE